MKHKCIFLLLVLVFTSVGNLWADVATEGEHNVYIELLNGKDFPKYKFFIKFQDYYYDMGYQPGDVSNVYLEPGKHISTGDQGSASLIYAEGKKGECKSTTEVGGADIVHDDRISYLLDRIKITKVSGKTISYEVVERQLIGENGEVLQTIKKGSLEPLDRGALMIWMLPIVCLVGLVLFFLFRRKSTAA